MQHPDDLLLDVFLPGVHQLPEFQGSRIRKGIMKSSVKIKLQDVSSTVGRLPASSIRAALWQHLNPSGKPLPLSEPVVRLPEAAPLRNSFAKASPPSMTMSISRLSRLRRRSLTNPPLRKPSPGLGRPLASFKRPKAQAGSLLHQPRKVPGFCALPFVSLSPSCKSLKVGV